MELNEKLDLIYIINKYAKKYSEMSKSLWEKDFGAASKICSERKKALYNIKEKLLVDLQTQADEIVLHGTSNGVFFLLKFPNNSFHLPQTANINRKDIDRIKLDNDVKLDEGRNINSINNSLKEKTQNTRRKETTKNLNVSEKININENVENQKKEDIKNIQEQKIMREIINEEELLCKTLKKVKNELNINPNNHLENKNIDCLDIKWFSR